MHSIPVQRDDNPYTVGYDYQDTHNALYMHRHKLYSSR